MARRRMVFRTVCEADWRKEEGEVAVCVDAWGVAAPPVPNSRLVQAGTEKGLAEGHIPAGVSGCGLAYGRLGGGVLLRRWSAEGWRRHMGSNESLSDPGAAGRPEVCGVNVCGVRSAVWGVIGCGVGCARGAGSVRRGCPAH